MNRTRYCSTCGALLGESAAICGECGARYQESPYERRATDAPVAWSRPPRQRSRDLGAPEPEPTEEEGIELISRESILPREPGATALRSEEQYDRMMVTQPPMPQSAPGAPTGPPNGPGSSAPSYGAPATGTFPTGVLEAPLDGCAPASPVKRLVAALIDGAIVTVLGVPLLIGVILLLVQESSGLLAAILTGVGVALPVAYALVMIWLTGSKGFTLGKLALGLRITRRSDGGGIGLLRALGRWVLYGIIPWLMALSIFLDPQKVLRGFHDRAVDSVVVDIRTGRNPMVPRADDFERPADEQYLGAPSVAVSAHDNLLTEPGSPWSGDVPQGDGSPAAAGSTAWADVPATSADPYAPSSADSYASPSVVAAAQEPPADAPSWSAPSPAYAPSDPMSSPSGPAAPSQPAPEVPVAHDPAVLAPDGADAAWAPPATSPAGPAAPEQSDAQLAWQPPNPESGAPHEITGDAWAHPGGDVDEQTRLTAPAEPLEDLEQTRMSVARTPVVTKLRLTLDDGVSSIIGASAVVGRNPTGLEHEESVVLQDETRSVSKTHLRIDASGDEILVSDLGSTNGSTLVREDGSRDELVPNTPAVLPSGATLELGDRTVTVEREQ